MQVLQKAICPEKRAGLDSALSAIASVTEVRLSSDLQVAKVYISIFSDDRGKETAMRQLSKLQGCVAHALLRAGNSLQLWSPDLPATCSWRLQWVLGSVAVGTVGMRR